MPLSVVIPTFNQRTVLAECLDALASRTTDVETIVVNGPSTDGTSGMIHERSDVDILVELSTRNVNVARNVGISRASAGLISFLDPRNVVTDEWDATVRQHLAGSTDAISGPVIGTAGPQPTAEDLPGGAAEHTITPGNVAVTRNALFALDGFDEYLELGGMADFTQRLRATELSDVWHPAMAVERIGPASNRSGGTADVDHAWFESEDTDWGRRYRSMTYRVVKNEGLGVRQLGDVLAAAIGDGVQTARDVMHGTTEASHWYRSGWSVLRNAGGGIYDGSRARRTDRTSARNPHGLSNSAGDSVVVDHYDWR